MQQKVTMPDTRLHVCSPALCRPTQRRLAPTQGFASIITHCLPHIITLQAGDEPHDDVVAAMDPSLRQLLWDQEYRNITRVSRVTAARAAAMADQGLVPCTYRIPCGGSLQCAWHGCVVHPGILMYGAQVMCGTLKVRMALCAKSSYQGDMHAIHPLLPCRRAAAAACAA